MKSKITGGSVSLLFTEKVLNKYSVNYYQCDETGFIQTEEPYWLNEAYRSAITKLDVGLVYRNIHLADLADKLLIKFFDFQGSFLDFAGGYGLFTRIMRDKGFNFYHTDPFCRNVFAEYFDLSCLSGDHVFEMVTAFEVLEHLSNPVDKIRDIARYSDNLLFTTDLQPQNIANIKEWNYLSFETGQHISFYNEKSLKYLAKTFGHQFYTNGRDTHLFTRKALHVDPFNPPKVREPFLVRKARKYVKKVDDRERVILESRIGDDWQHIKNKLNI